MKYLIPIFFLLGSQLFADDKSFDLYFQINYHNTFGEETKNQKKYFAPFKQTLATRFQLQADLGENSELSLQLNPFGGITSQTGTQNEPYTNCKGLMFVEEAKVSYYVSEIFSFDLGCVQQKRGGFNTKETSDLSLYETGKTNLLYSYLKQSRYTPAFNFHFDVFGTFTLQVLHRMGEQENLPAFNIQWTMSLLGIEPLIQFGLYGDQMESMHYDVSLRAEFEQFTLKGGYFSDMTNKKGEKKSLASWNLYAFYENSNWLQPFLRVFSVETKDKTKNLIEDQYLSFSFGNKMEVYDNIEPYISLNLIRDQKTEENDFQVVLGVAATI